MRYLTILKSFSFIFFAWQIGSSQENYTLSEESVLTVQGTSTVHEWTMALNEMEGYLTLDDNQLKAVYFEAKVADLQSERGITMDNKAKEALKYKEHSKIIFAAAPVPVQPVGKDTFTFSGTLTIAGTAKKINIPSKITKGKDFIRLEGNLKITLQDFKIEPPTAMFGSIVVGDLVSVDFNLLFQVK